ncbi:MAG: alanine--tRNA ligase [Candidatus Krumholzibacteriia bacterium]
MEAKEIRSRFLDFFAARGHRVVPSSSLVPQDDPTLLFANAGMNQFKSVLLGLERRDYVRAASVQKCMRVAGKHNDLEEVGKDARHHTFFEMLGNWSFGEYYKRESILWGWEFLTGEMQLDPERLWVTVYKDDDEAFAVWRDEVRVPERKIIRLGDVERGDEENFWSMAATGPCGPCTEIHWDRGEAARCSHPDGCAVGVCDCDRWLELWNHVFMEFDRQPDGSLQPLPMKSVDTGLGFERLVSVMQGTESNYETDLFSPLVRRAAQLSGREPQGADRISMQVIADHARAVVFTITDGARPSNEGRGYVVRRILRRAARHGHLLGLEEPFLWRVAEVVIDEMGDAYPELRERRDRVLPVIRQEEERFLRTLAAGLQIYGESRERMKREGRTVVSGEEAFQLHDTYGFPLDLTAVVSEEDGFTVDGEGFERLMGEQRVRSRREVRFMEGIGAWEVLRDDLDLAGYRNRFVGYDRLTAETEPLAVRDAGTDAEGRPLAHLLVAETPFYAESGGQVGDVGTVTLLPAGEDLQVVTTLSAPEGSVCVVSGGWEDVVVRLRSAERVRLSVDQTARAAVMRHHTATHLLHRALREVLGDHVEQAGSVVAPDRLRFDFRHDAPVSDGELARIEQLVNERVLANRPVLRHEDVPLDEARARGAMALFGEKYADRVRMIEVPLGVRVDPAEPDSGGSTWSLELCGGTHCFRTGDIGPFRIVSESGIAAGVRRIEAVAGEPALAMIEREHAELADVARQLRRDGGSPGRQVAELIAERDQLRKDLARVQQATARDALQDAIASPVAVQDLKLVAALVTAESRDALMQLGDHARDRLGENGVVVLAAEVEGKAAVIATVTPDLVASRRLHAGDLVKALTARAGGRGGGKPNMAQGGVPTAADLASVVAAAADVVGEQVG